MQKTMEKPTEKEALEAEIAALKTMKTRIEKESEEIKVRHNAEVERRLTETRRADAQVSEKRERFETDKKEFEEILKAFRFEKAQFETDRQAMHMQKALAQETLEKVGVFIRMVRDGAAKL